MIVTSYDRVLGKSLESPTYIEAKECLEEFKTGGDYKDTILEIRELAKDKEANKEKITELKTTLPVVYFCGEFKDNPVKKNFVNHSGLLILDFDDTDTVKLKEQFKKRPFTYSCFDSPSGNNKSLKVLLRIPVVKNEKEYQIYFDFFLSKLPQLDKSGRNINRAAFKSYDEKIYINENATEFELPKGYFFTMSHPDQRLIAVCNKILKSPRGESHMAVLAAAYTAGGIVAAGLIPESVAIKALEDAANARRPKEIKDSQMAIQSAFAEGMSKPLYDDESISHAIKKFDKPKIRKVDGNSLIVSREKIQEVSTLYNEGNLVKARTLGIPYLDDYLVFRDNSFYMIVGGRASGKTTTLTYLFTLDAFVHQKKTLICALENEGWELEQEVVGMLTGNNAKWLYINDRPRYNKAADFFHQYFTVLNTPPDYTFYDIFDAASQINSQSQYDRLFIDPASKIAGASDYAENKKVAAHAQPFAKEEMALWISFHPTGSTQRAGGQPTDLSAEFGSTFSNAADVSMTIARDYKSPEENIRNTVCMTIDKMRSKKIMGGSETYKDYPIKLEYIFRKNGYRLFIPRIDTPDHYERIDNPFTHLKQK